MSPMNIRVRMIILIVFIAVATALCGIRLMKIQIVDGETYLEQSKYAAKGTQLIKAARGEIVDTNGIQIVKNKAGFNVIIEAAFFPKDYEEGNEIILKTAKILMEDNVERVESIPISKTQPYTYLPDRERDIKVMLDDEHLRLNVYATPDDCINALIERYEISDKYTTEEKRIIAGVRYEMLLRGFSVSNRYTFAVDVPVVTVSKIKELSYKIQGVDIAEEAVRVYAQSDILSHSIGTVGPIYAEEYEVLKEEGYKLNDVLGKSGIEKFMENELRGSDGTRTTLISGGKVISVTDTIPAVPGNTVKLTVDSDYQRDVQNILANHIKWLNMYSTEEKGKNAYAGAIVVLDAKTGAVKAIANAPTYDIYDYINNYSEVLGRENQPLVNRAIDGLYRPGSTFKTVTATAVLNEGIIEGTDTVNCTQVYTYYNDIAPTCLGHHGKIPVTEALRVSCNIFFYDTGRQIGIDKIDEYAAYYGLGENVGLEIGGSKGWVSSPDVFADYKMDWTPGQVLQAAIGQSETAVTPLQMAVQAMTIANEGVRYKPYIIEGVYDYNLENELYKTEPVIVSQIPIKNDDTFYYVEEGMKQAAAFEKYYGVDYSLYPDYTLTDLPYPACIKTGTPQKSKDIVNSAVVGYYPADDPEIAFACYVEEGEYSKLMVRQLIDAYYGYGYYADGEKPQYDENLNLILPEGEEEEITSIAENIPDL